MKHSDVLGVFGADRTSPYHVARALLACRGVEDERMDLAAAARILCASTASDDIAFWRQLAAEAEHHGIAPLLLQLMTELAQHDPALIPPEIHRTFLVLARRHHGASLAREECIDRLLDAFNGAGIEVLLLKGAALAHQIYPRPELRPMVDIDLLIDPRDQAGAVALAHRLGYVFAADYASRFAGRHHHLPVAETIHANFLVSLEIHTDAISANHADQLNFRTMQAAPRRLSRGAGPDALCFGHIDMLHHLTRHTFGPARNIRLIHLYDLWRFRVRFRDEIDWQALERYHPQVINALRMTLYVFPGDDGAPLTPVPRPAPQGVGAGMAPLSEIAASDCGLSAKVNDVFNPPAWWLHGFYGVPPEDSLLACRAVKHPMTVARWLTKRIFFSSGVTNLASNLAAEARDQLDVPAPNHSRTMTMTHPAAISVDQVPAPADGIEAEEIDGEFLLFCPRQTRAIYLNHAATVVWQLCNGIYRVRDIIALIADAFPENAESMTDEILSAVSEMQECGVVVLR